MTTKLVFPIVAALALGATAARADGVRHVPPAEAEAGAPLALSAQIDDAGHKNVFLHYRARGAAAWIDVAFTHAPGGDWVAAIPAEAMVPPGVEYYLSSAPVGDAAATAGTTATGTTATAPTAALDEFGSADDPHPVVVRLLDKAARRDRDLARVGGRRSRAHAAAEYVDFGQRHNAAGVEVSDSYYRVDLDFAYRLLTYPLEEIRFGYSRLQGVVPNSDRRVPDGCNPNPPSADDPSACKVDAGFKVGGWFELGLGPTEGVRFDARGMFTANQDGFALGVRGELRAGVADGNHLALAVEYLADVGTIASFRLGWATVPRVPMAMSVEITDLPKSTRATGVRLLYDVFYPLPTGLRLGARLGYAARDQIIGGPSAGLSASYDF